MMSLLHHPYFSPALFFISKPTLNKLTLKSTSSNPYGHTTTKQNKYYCKTSTTTTTPTTDSTSKNHVIMNWWSCSNNNKNSNIISLAAAVAVAIIITTTTTGVLPSSAIPSLSSKPFSLPNNSTTTPFSQAQNLPTGLDNNGKIRPCPSINPGCVSSNPKSSNFAFPWRILGDSSSNSASIQQLQDALLKTQKNVKIQPVQDTPNGQYLKAEVDGGFGGRDVLEFLVNGDVVTFRAMATKVTYVYPFTTALGDSKGQEERMKKIINELGWYAPSFESMD